MIILGIETSCDETAAAILKGSPSTSHSTLRNEPSGSDSKSSGSSSRIQILSNIVASSASIQSKYGGIIPEQAAREQIKSIIPVIKETLQQAQCKPERLDAIAVTYGPGLIGSLLVGVETAKVLAKIWDKPLIPVNHLIGHFYANWISQDVPTFPCIGLLVSGGHTDLVLFTDHGKYQYLGGTRDDAAGECFDKCARLLGLPYPGGPEISKLAINGNPKAYNLPRPMINSKNFDFSFSGLKTAVANLLHTSEVGFLVPSEVEGDSSEVNDLAASIEAAIVDVLVEKTIKAAKKHGIKQIMVAGGVAANQKLSSDLKFKIENLKLKIKVAVSPPSLCTDNGAMIASAAFFLKQIKNPIKLQADPNLSLAY